jgi:hypothetical protein
MDGAAGGGLETPWTPSYEITLLFFSVRFVSPLLKAHYGSKDFIP